MLFLGNCSDVLKRGRQLIKHGTHSDNNNGKWFIYSGGPYDSRREISAERLEGKIWKKGDFYYIQGTCTPGPEVMHKSVLCNKKGLWNNKQLCESNPACVHIPSRRFKY